MNDETKEKPEQVGIYYQKARHYRTVHADGVWVGLSPTAKVQFSLYSELRPLPEFVLHQLTKEGRVGEQLEQVVKEGVIRETEINVVMDVPLTIQFIALLQQVISQVQMIQQGRINTVEQEPKGKE